MALLTQIRSYRATRLLHRPDSHHIKDKLSKMSDSPGMSHSYIYHMYPSTYLSYVYNKTHQYICYIQHNELLMKGTDTTATLKKGKGIPCSILSIGPGADPNVQTVSLQVTVSHPPGGRLPLLSARSAVTSPAAEHHRPLAGTKLYCW